MFSSLNSGSYFPPLPVQSYTQTHPQSHSHPHSHSLPASFPRVSVDSSKRRSPLKEKTQTKEKEKEKQRKSGKTKDARLVKDAALRVKAPNSFVSAPSHLAIGVCEEAAPLAVCESGGSLGSLLDRAAAGLGHVLSELSSEERRQNSLNIVSRLSSLASPRANPCSFISPLDSLLSPRAGDAVNLSAPSRSAIRDLIDRLQQNGHNDAIVALNHFFQEKKNDNLVEAESLAALEMAAEAASEQASEQAARTINSIKTAELKQIHVLGEYYKHVQARQAPVARAAGEPFDEQTQQARREAAGLIQLPALDDAPPDAVAGLRAAASADASELLIALLLAEKRELVRLLADGQRREFEQFEDSAAALISGIEQLKEQNRILIEEKQRWGEERIQLLEQLERAQLSARSP